LIIVYKLNNKKIMLRSVSSNKYIKLEMQAMIRILCKKGITTEDETMQERVKLKAEMEQKMRDAQKLN